MANVLIPEYLSIDFSTLVANIKTELASSDIFKDYNYEGSNIAILIELLAYIGELNTYFLNKIAKNVFMETCDIYENANRISRQEGYEPKGYTSSRTTLSVTISAGDAPYYVEGDMLYIPAWHKIASTKEYDGSTIYFSTVSPTLIEADSEIAQYVALPVMQGTPITYNYTGNDIVRNEIILPTKKFAYDGDLEDTANTVSMTVNEELWTRVPDFYDEISGLNVVDTVYMMRFDRFKRMRLVFNSARTVPTKNDAISITLLETMGLYGNVAANTITTPNDNFVKNTTNTEVGENEDGWLPNSTISVSNSAASYGGDEPEGIEELRDSVNAIHNTQYRNVTADDYEAFLETRDDVNKAHAYGEQEIAPSGNIWEYNKVHISVVPPNYPESWATGTINTSTYTWTPSGTEVASETVYVPTEYISTYTANLEEFLEPRKMLNAYEVWELPTLVYLSFTIGIRLKRLYSFADVSTDLLNKLIYYFRPDNMDFYKIINFMDIEEFLLDTTEISETDDFDYIKGIRNLVIRDIDCTHEIHEVNLLGNYPYYTTSTYHSDTENKLRPIQLGHTQFPILSPSTVHIVEES